MHKKVMAQVCFVNQEQNIAYKRPCQGGGGGSHVACLNFKTSRVSVYKCLSLIVGFAVTVAIWPRVEGGCLL